MRTHTGEKPYKCDKCDYSAAFKPSLDRHLATHTGQKPYKCDQCDYSTAWKSHLDYHLTKHTGGKPYMCGEYGYMTTCQFSLAQHMKGQKPYKCDQCSYSAASKAFTSDLTRRREDRAARVPVYVKRKTIIGSRLNMATTGQGSPTEVGENLDDGSPTGVFQVDCDSKTSNAQGQAAAQQVTFNNAGEKPYMCGECGTHTGEKPYKCDQCDYSAAQKTMLDTHLAKHTGEKPFMCGECGYRTADRSHLSRHMRTHTGEKPYKCDQCDYSAAQKSDLYRHQAKHSISFNNAGEKPYMCGECGYRTTRKSHLSLHMKIHTGEKPYMCGECGYRTAYRSNLSRHMRTHTGENKCDQCDYSAAWKCNLHKHLTKHTGEKRYICEECGYRTAKKSDLSRHMRTHTGEKPYKCDQCDYSAAQKSTHTGEKPYLCGEGGYRTAVRSNLSQHMRTHTGERPYKCDQCDYSAAQKVSLDEHKANTPVTNATCVGNCDYSAVQKSNLDQHLVKHTGEKPYMCGECGYRTARKRTSIGRLGGWSVFFPMRTHTGEKPCKCDQCDYSAAQKSSLDKHNVAHDYQCESVDTGQLKMYRKPTHTDQYLAFDSHHPLEHKLAVIKTLFHRADNIVTSDQAKTDEQRHLRGALAKCGYQNWTFNKALIPSDQSKKTQKCKPLTNKNKANITIPYVQGVSEKLRRIFQNFNIATNFKPHSTPRQRLVHPKDRPHKGTKANVIYRLKCEGTNCNNTYIGETSRPLKAAIFHHLQHNQGHSFKLESTDVLDRETRWWERGVKEAIYERMYNPTLNREGGLRVDLSGTWDLALPAPRTDNT
ncbi:hypothetical protein Bbelb_234710 [Branchiostoma belcheri]|nr:hypothetical protein Bbelb_234710 [Branchiostoma belcheri]